ncbi:MAG: hypothetical protein IGR76_10395 [Synechococcales cyanobacterium T60_A2020_003]|nr:hypothetical protein [Synechococcales cyanobacterium T60_A2020_003]
MLTQQECKALGKAHKAALLDQLSRRIEVANRQGNLVLLKQLEAEADYINTQPTGVNLKALLDAVKAEANQSQKPQ